MEKILLIPWIIHSIKKYLPVLFLPLTSALSPRVLQSTDARLPRVRMAGHVQ